MKQKRDMSKFRITFMGLVSPISNRVLWVLAISFIVLILMNSVNADGLSNKFCPVTTSELAEEQFFVDYQDQRIYFCCNNCKRDFLANTDAYLANLKTSDAEAHDHSETEHEHGNEVAEVGTEDHEANADASHDHATDHGDSSSVVRFIGKFHPMVTHFPIALVLTAFLFSALAFVFKVQTFEIVSVYSIYVAAITGIATVALGLAAGYNASYPSFLAGYLSIHRLLGIATAITTFATAYYGHRQLQTKSGSNVWIYRGLILLNSVLVGVTGHYGATLVFGPDHFNY